MSDSKKVLLVGWDAADWKIINPLMDEGRMPTLQGLVERGTLGNMATLSPVLSPMLWTSIATGKRPFKHGIYGFTEPNSTGTSVQPMTNSSRKCKAVWNILNQNALQSIVVGWWPSHPAEPINGAMVSDFFHKAPKQPGQEKKMMPKSIHPDRLIKEVSELWVHPLELGEEHILPFIPHGKDIDQAADHRMSSCLRTISECTSIQTVATHLMETEPWDFAAIYFDAIDHFCHGFMRYHPPKQAHVSENDFKMYQNVVASAYIYHDMMLKRLLELSGKETTVILMSDHGFHPDHLRPRSLPMEPAGPALEHRDYGIFLVSGPGIKKDHITHGVSLLDVTPTILSIFGLPIGADMDGMPLVDIFEQEPELKSIPSWENIDGDDGQHPKEMKIDPAESREALEQLIDLGYIDRPDKDSEKAIANCTCELNYNLARSYMDAGMHGEATPILLKLYQQYPLEFRFGIQLANCLKAMDQIPELERLIEHLNTRWRVAATEARKRVGGFAKLARERKKQWLELKKLDDEERDDPSNPRRARVSFNGRPQLFNADESQDIRKLRAVAKGNPQTLDFLAATVAMSKGDFETALENMKHAVLTKSKNPSFHYHLGNVYLGLGQFQEAQNSYLTTLELDESNPNAMMGLCRTFLEIGKNERALDFGRQATGLKFHFPVAHYFMGMAKYKTNNLDGAINSLNTAIGQNPNFVEAHLLLAKIHSTPPDNDFLSRTHAGIAKRLRAEIEDNQRTNISIDLPELANEELDMHLPDLPDPDPVPDSNEQFINCLAQPKTDDKHSVPQTSNNKQSKNESTGSGNIVVVSGLPRSGTSVMMQMLVAGGIEPFADDLRAADESNPRGYYESDIAKQLARNNKWLLECNGQVVKIVAPLIPYLPQCCSYRVIFMERNLEEIMASQTTMLERLGKTGGNIASERLSEVFSQHFHHATKLLSLHGIPTKIVDFRNLVSNPNEVAKLVVEFLEMPLDVEAMGAVVDPSLYRQRK